MSLISVWTIIDNKSRYLIVPSEGTTCECEYCTHEHHGKEKQFFNVVDIMGRITEKDYGKKVYYNTTTKCFSVENDEQKEEREKREQ